MTTLAVDNLHWTGVRCRGGHLNRFLYVLVSLSQEDWVRKASLFLPIYAAYLAELRTQNRFHDHDLDDLQYQFGFADKVRSCANVNQTPTNPSSFLTAGVLISVRGFPRI